MLAAKAQREAAPRSGALRRSLGRLQARGAVEPPKLDCALTAANDDQAPPAPDFNEAIKPGLIEQCRPDCALRLHAPRRGGKIAGLFSAVASLSLHGAALAAAMFLFGAVTEFQPAGEEAIPVEFVVAGDEVEQAASQEGAQAKTDVAPPDLPDTPPVDIAKELPQVEPPPVPDPPPVDVAAALPEVAVPPLPDAPPVDVPAEQPPMLAEPELPPLPDVPQLADLTPPTLATPAAEPERDAVPATHQAPKPTEAKPDPKPAAPKPVEPKKVVAKKVEATKVEPKKPQPKPKKIEPRQVAARSAEKPAPRAQAAQPTGRGARGAGDSDSTRQASTRGGAASISSYRAQVMAHLARYKVYPEQARSTGVTGRASVAFTLTRGGQVVSASISGSSGASILDQATLAMVRRAAPFPAMPDGSPGSMSFNAGVNYSLR